MKHIRSAVTLLNNLFISIVLIFVYLVVIGFSALVFHIVGLFKPKGKRGSYWEELKEEKFDGEYFKSPY